jgi:hypothetical protein
MEVSILKLVLTLVTVTLLATFAGATTVDFNSYTPLDTCTSSVSTGGLDFNGTNDCVGSYMYVWDGSSPNGNGTPALIFAGFGSGATMTMSLTAGGTSTLNSVDMTISWYDSNPSEVITVNGNPITLVPGPSDVQSESDGHVVHVLRFAQRKRLLANG